MRNDERRQLRRRTLSALRDGLDLLALLDQPPRVMAGTSKPRLRRRLRNLAHTNVIPLRRKP